MERRIRVALIGAGIFARDTYVPHFKRFADRVELVAVLSRSSESVNATAADKVARFVGEQGEEEFFSRAKEICDGVVVCVPIPLLGKYVERCLRAGLHVMSEKPVAMTSQEGKELIRLHKSLASAVCWIVAENYRCEPAVLAAAQVVRGRKPKAFNLVVIRPQSKESKFMKTEWRSKPAYHGASVFDGGIHFVAMLRAVLGDLSDIQATFEAVDNIEVSSCGSCRAGGVLGSFQIRYGAFSDSVSRLDVYFSDGAASLVQVRGVGYHLMVPGEQNVRVFEFGGLALEFEAWINTFHGERAPHLSPEEALADLEAIEAMCCKN